MIAIVVGVVAGAVGEAASYGLLVERVVAVVARRPVFLSDVRAETHFARGLGTPPCAKEKALTGACWKDLGERIIRQRVIDEEAQRAQAPLPEPQLVAELAKRLEREWGGRDAVRAFRSRYALDEKEYLNRLAIRIRAEKLQAERSAGDTDWLKELYRRFGVTRLVDLEKEPP